MVQVKRLLGYGAAAGPVYLVVGLAQVLPREGFDVRRHALSQFEQRRLWVGSDSQFFDERRTGARRRRGCPPPPRRRTRSSVANSPWRVWVCLIGAGIFIADPARGFPPGTPLSDTPITTHGLMHFVFGGIGFYSLIAACFVFARRFASLGRLAWALYSAFTGVGFFCAFAAIASGSTSVAIMLTFYAAVAWVWVWHTALLVTLLRDAAQNSAVSRATRSAAVPRSSR